jgi:drug/metabolite transporter (DMT)-like permease
VNGYLAAALAVLIWACYPVATRAAVTGAFDAHDLVTLRFGVGALLFTPYLLLRWRHFARAVWLQGVPLTLFHGAGMAALAIAGMQLAPANHAAALGPGVSPAWVALLGFLLFAQRPSRRAVGGAALCVGGVALLAFSSAAESTLAVLTGDAMFLGASALAALYVLQLRRWGIDAMQGAAIVSLYSACLVVPHYVWSAPGTLAHVAPPELLWQVLWQGVLIGCVAVIALNHAIFRLGAERSSALVAFVPVLTAALALVFLGEVPSTVEVIAFCAISAGVSVGAAPGRRAGPTPEGQLLAAPSQNALRAGFPARDNAR